MITWKEIFLLRPIHTVQTILRKKFIKELPYKEMQVYDFMPKYNFM